MIPPVLSGFFSPIIIKNSLQVQQRDALRQTSVCWPQGSWNVTQRQQQPQNKNEPFWGECLRLA